MILKIDHDNIMAKISRSYDLALLGNFEDSKKGFINISKLHFEDWMLINTYYLHYGWSLEVMEKYDEAINVYNEYLDNYDFPKEDIENEKEKLLKLIG